MRLRRSSVALATIVAALAGATAIDNASAGFRRDELRGILLGETALYRFQSNAGTSQPSNRSLRGRPDMGGRGMRDGGRMNGGSRGMRSGGRMNGGMGRR